jgi:hypothetical protein
MKRRHGPGRHPDWHHCTEDDDDDDAWRGGLIDVGGLGCVCPTRMLTSATRDHRFSPLEQENMEAGFATSAI